MGPSQHRKRTTGYCEYYRHGEYRGHTRGTKGYQGVPRGTKGYQGALTTTYHVAEEALPCRLVAAVCCCEPRALLCDSPMRLHRPRASDSPVQICMHARTH
jgi:hypothetical protein